MLKRKKNDDNSSNSSSEVSNPSEEEEEEEEEEVPKTKEEKFKLKYKVSDVIEEDKFEETLYNKSTKRSKQLSKGYGMSVKSSNRLVKESDINEDQGNNEISGNNKKKHSGSLLNLSLSRQSSLNQKNSIPLKSIQENLSNENSDDRNKYLYNNEHNLIGEDINYELNENLSSSIIPNKILLKKLPLDNDNGEPETPKINDKNNSNIDPYKQLNDLEGPHNISNLNENNNLDENMNPIGDNINNVNDINNSTTNMNLTSMTTNSITPYQLSNQLSKKIIKPIIINENKNNNSYINSIFRRNISNKKSKNGLFLGNIKRKIKLLKDLKLVIIYRRQINNITLPIESKLFELIQKVGEIFNLVKDEMEIVLVYKNKISETNTNSKNQTLTQNDKLHSIQTFGNETINELNDTASPEKILLNNINLNSSLPNFDKMEEFEESIIYNPTFTKEKLDIKISDLIKYKINVFLRVYKKTIPENFDIKMKYPSQFNEKVIVENVIDFDNFNKLISDYLNNDMLIHNYLIEPIDKTKGIYCYSFKTSNFAFDFHRYIQLIKISNDKYKKIHSNLKLSKEVSKKNYSMIKNYQINTLTNNNINKHKIKLHGINLYNSYNTDIPKKREIKRLKINLSGSYNKYDTSNIDMSSVGIENTVINSNPINLSYDSKEYQKNFEKLKILHRLNKRGKFKIKLSKIRNNIFRQKN